MENVTILMSTYNGEKYIEKQLESLFKQKNVNVSVKVRDDGSTDNTVAILEKYKDKGLLEWYSGENLKPAKSFLDLLKNAPESEFYAFCDQDDVWLEDKLIIGIERLKKCDKDIPTLYYGAPRIVDKDLNSLGISKLSKEKMTDFRSSLIESNATGCTMVFNTALAKLVNQKTPGFIGMHDRWLHKVCLAMGGTVCFDEDVHILYRQHDNNVVGISNSVFNKIKRRFFNTDCNRSRTVKSLVECYGDKMSNEDLKLAILVADYKTSIIKRIELIFNRKIKCDYKKRNIIFRIMVLLGTF